MPKIKLIVFDMDNVLFDVGYFENHEAVAASTWGVIWGALKAQKEEKELHEKWATGGHKNYVHWEGDTLSVYKKYGLTQKMFDEIINNLPLMKGAKETLKTLKEKGYSTAIISGSFQELGMRAHKELGIDFIITACSLVFDKNGNLTDWALLPSDYEGKVHFFNALISSLNIKPEECALIGDGVNDIPLARVVGLSIAFNAREELKKHCDFIVDGKDIRKILQYL
jgi:phosphoserine phosphatase